jgi:hypothetical protein
MEKSFLDEDKLIRDIGSQLIEQYSDKGIVPGVNGPYNDQETIIRNLSHLIVITALEILLFSRNELVDKLVNMGDTLISMRQKDGSYILRNNDKKDRSNGVIGHAWVMEAFLYLYKVLADEKYINIALQIYTLHEFDSNLGLWRRPKIEKSESAVDYTLNHQLWFAGISAKVLEYTKDMIMINDFKRFFLNLEKNITIDSNGLICHSVLIKGNGKSTFKSYLKRYIDLIRRNFKKPSYYYKEVGYHIFNVAALARLFLIFSDDSFWESAKFKKIIDKTNSESLYNDIQISDVMLDVSLNNSINNNSEKKLNIYGFPYNVPGFEMCYVSEVFKDRIDVDITKEYLQKQFELTYDESQGKLAKNCFDKVTINYRIYEYYLALEVRDRY